MIDSAVLLNAIRAVKENTTPRVRSDRSWENSFQGTAFSFRPDGKLALITSTIGDRTFSVNAALQVFVVENVVLREATEIEIAELETVLAAIPSQFYG